MDDAAKKLLADALESEFTRAPPTICVIGLSGVGKSSTINALFGTKKTVSHSIRGTSRFHASNHQIVSRRMAEFPVTCTLRIYDAPGLGEDHSFDRNYLERYRTHLPKCDIAIWVVAARNRAIALDQTYLKALEGALPASIVLAINQVDLVEPMTWNESLNLPSKPQKQVIDDIISDRTQKFTPYVGAQAKIVPYSALRYYNLQSLFLACIESAPPARRWMFDLMKSFSTLDWLGQAKGLTEQQRLRLADQYISKDLKISLEQLGRASGKHTSQPK